MKEWDFSTSPNDMWDYFLIGDIVADREAISTVIEVYRIPHGLGDIQTLKTSNIGFRISYTFTLLCRG
jgi:hypothetical protein